MKKIARPLVEAFSRRMRETGVQESLHRDYLMWLRFYLDFCAKYRYPPRDPDSVGPFLQKLSSKGQSPERQRDAAAGVALYHELMKNWASAPEADHARERRQAP